MLGDPTKALGALAEAECARVVAALDLAEKLSRRSVVRVVLRRNHFREAAPGCWTGVACAASHRIHRDQRGRSSVVIASI